MPAWNEKKNVFKLVRECGKWNFLVLTQGFFFSSFCSQIADDCERGYPSVTIPECLVGPQLTHPRKYPSEMWKCTIGRREWGRGWIEELWRKLWKPALIIFFREYFFLNWSDNINQIIFLSVHRSWKVKAREKESNTKKSVKQCCQCNWKSRHLIKHSVCTRESDHKSSQLHVAFVWKNQDGQELKLQAQKVPPWCECSLLHVAWNRAVKWKSWVDCRDTWWRGKLTAALSEEVEIHAPGKHTPSTHSPWNWGLHRWLDLSR